jgi:hypothetical protein
MKDDILSIIFLGFIAIVAAGIFNSLLPTSFMMPIFVMISVCLWISYDYILIKRHKLKQQCNKSDNRSKESIHESNCNDELLKFNRRNMNSDDQLDKIAQSIQVTPVSNICCKKEKSSNDISLDMYNDVPITEIHENMGSPGDNKLVNRMKYLGLQPKLSQDIRSRMNVRKFAPYFEEELDEQEKRAWWEQDADKLDAFM